ncbi:hypothetical protein TorRG33x02_039000, partial [Trema orientale]
DILLKKEKRRKTANIALFFTNLANENFSAWEGNKIYSITKDNYKTSSWHHNDGPLFCSIVSHYIGAPNMGFGNVWHVKRNTYKFIFYNIVKPKQCFKNIILLQTVVLFI